METEFSELLGQTLREITGLAKGNDHVTFVTENGAFYDMFHEQACCESVAIEDVCGDVKDLIGFPLLQAEEVVGADEPDPEGFYESHTWTFYKLATIKGYVTIRWLGMSNGYYSEAVSFTKR